MLENKRFCVVLTMALLFIGITSSPLTANAQPASETVTAGGLGFAVTPGNFTFPGVTLNGSSQTPSTTQSWDVADNTGSYNGWNLQITAAALTSGSNTLPQPSVTAPYTPTQTCDFAGQCIPAATGSLTTAVSAYGQGDFVTSTPNTNGIHSASISGPRKMALDTSGNLYVADFNNNRVLYYPAGSTVATRVYGQAGSFTTNTANKGGISANSLSGPFGLALDASGNLYIAEGNNNRVLYYPAGSTTATRVYGQAGSFTTNNSNNGGISANSLSSPDGLALDASGNLYVADNLNNRVLYYPAGSTTATRVYGQAGSFTTATSNNGGITASSLSQPIDITVDSSGNPYISDFNNSRVLYFTAGSTTATSVYGQAGSFTTGTQNTGGVSANSLNNPIGLSLDSSNNLYIADTYNNRVLYFPSGSTTATRVYGQGGVFTTNTANKGGISASSLGASFSVLVSSTDTIYIADSGNNRVLYYVPPVIITYPITLPTSAVKVLNASQNTGVGAGTFNAQTYQVTVPATTHIGTYSATWTLALTSGP